jgi:hypothetical protein
MAKRGRKGILWDVYCGNKLMGTYLSLNAAGASIGVSAHYAWQMANGKTGIPKYYKLTTHTTRDGYSIKKHNAKS